MPALNFQKQFAPAVKSGKKRQTIRAARSDGRNPRVNQMLYLYTGMRTKGCRKLGEGVCRQSLPVYMNEHDNGMIDLYINGDAMDFDQVEQLAKDDGFDNVDDFYSFFRDRLPFRGYLIRW